ncbi:MULTISPECIES: DUF3616 domain-containing protein [Nostoc]|uniref:DUF3616 domain-containing protein n=2 Tax=Nostoc TaxID=1177 RepID=A0ABR8IKN4_9NOSO|nr:MULTISPECIES: DUF3616 domain-containing protein [Nostoc]MBD2566149.1 DUF3616 domain-containing protein [Nostoc linckia FACHB-391]MBD2651748.1 DUF3616 domain-containing protein [Nostoc foliaceum FACHB-393]
MEKLTIKIIEESKYRGICDSSAGVAIANKNQFVVANDEDNLLRVYQSANNSSGKTIVDLGQLLPAPTKIEMDIEGSATIDNIVYWITSHARNSQGELRPTRHNFLAVKFTVTGEEVNVLRVGHSYRNLLGDMLIKNKQIKKFLESAELLPPEAEGGLNIEGLCSTPNKELYIGFRNPIPNQKSLLIPLKKPADLVNKAGVSADFGDPILLDLGGRGIRSIEYCEAHKIYLIIAGAFDNVSNFALYQWSGNVQENPELIDFTFPEDFRPESLFFYPDREDELQIMSDDGGAKRDGVTQCKDLENDSDKFFRSILVKIVK